jgi:RNA polymerase sigma-70 factor (ECF subfamily)
MAELSLGKLKRGGSEDPPVPATREASYAPHSRPESDLPVALETELAEIAAAQRDSRAFAPIYERYVDLVYRYALRQLRDPERAEDATGTVFSHALAALPAFTPQRRANEGSSFRSWLMTIARNVAIDSIRRHPATTTLDDPLIQSDLHDRSASPEEQAMNAFERQRIERALAALPPIQRQIVELRAIGMSGAEIAEILQMKVGAVKTAHFRAYAKLRDLLKTGNES